MRSGAERIDLLNWFAGGRLWPLFEIGRQLYSFEIQPPDWVWGRGRLRRWTWLPVCALTEDDSLQENQRRSFENKHDRNIVLYRHCHQQLQTLCLLPYAEIEVAKRCDTKSGNVVLDSESLRRLIWGDMRRNIFRRTECRHSKSTPSNIVLRICQSVDRRCILRIWCAVWKFPPVIADDMALDVKPRPRCLRTSNRRFAAYSTLLLGGENSGVTFLPFSDNLLPMDPFSVSVWISWTWN